VAVCTPDCTGAECGGDGCGGSCGTCWPWQTCEDGQCVAVCRPNCRGVKCGDDGCGGSCGTCDKGKTCEDGKCVRVVVFPDPNLEQAIRQAIGKPTGDIYADDLLGLTHLSALSKRLSDDPPGLTHLSVVSNISDLSGLEYCTALDSLGISYSNIADLSPLAGLTNLTGLNLVNPSPLTDTETRITRPSDTLL
jgi:hypothetical protein